MRNETRRIGSWDVLMDIARNNAPVYIRWSRGPAVDRRRPYSLNHSSHSREAGLSVQTIDADIMDKFDIDLRVSLLLLDYSFCGPVCSLWTGKVVGRGGDNEDVIEPTVCLGIVTPRVLDKARAIRTAGGY